MHQCEKTCLQNSLKQNNNKNCTCEPYLRFGVGTDGPTAPQASFLHEKQVKILMETFVSWDKNNTDRVPIVFEGFESFGRRIC